MKNKACNITYVISFLLLFIMTACNKMTDDKLEGTWININVADISSSNYEEWTFNHGTLKIIQILAPDTSLNILKADTSIFVGSYKVKNYRKLYISNFTIGNATAYDQIWDISTLTSHTLRIVHGPNGLTFKEFTKK